MSEQTPPPSSQVTPVGFSPVQSGDVGDAIGTVMPASRPDFEFTTFWPILIVLLTLIGGTIRDMAALNKRVGAINDDMAPALEMLKQSKKQSDFIDGLHASLQQLAPTDPVAAQIINEYFPAQTDQKPDASGDATPTPTPAK